MHDVRDIVAKRCVFYFGGYERASADRQYRRLVRELGRFEQTWTLAASAGDPVTAEDGSVLEWTIDARGPNWRVATRFHYCAWNDLIEEDFARRDWRSVPAGLAALADFIVTGTALRFFAVAWRYGLFFAYAVLLAAVPAALAWLIVRWLGQAGLSMPWFVGAPLGIAIFWALLRWPGERFNARYMLNDWNCASAIAWGRRHGYRKRIETFGRYLAETIRKSDADEVLIVGHSLGAVLAVEALAGALDRSPGLVRPSQPITLMTVGSSLLKIGLHPAARDLRRAVARVLEASDIAWIDYTALVDPLNFYRTDPGRVMGLKGRRGPILRTAKIRAMLGEAAYRRFRGNFLRLHRQFVMGNGARYHYDFFMACCGPMPQAWRIADMTLSVDNFAADGTYLPATRESDPVRRTAKVAQ